MAGKFFRRGITKVKFLPAIASALLVPTAPELTAGTDLTVDLAEVSGWQLTNSPIPVPSMADKFTSQIEGEDTVADSSLTFYDRDDAEVIRDVLAKGVVGYIVIAPYGFTAAKRLQVYYCSSTGVNDEFSVGNDAARFMVGFAIKSTPNLDATHP